MLDLDKLTPEERATQLGKPEGDLGIALSAELNRINSRLIPASYRCLELAAGMDVLEVGFGNGHTLASLLAQAEGLNYTGIDISQTMVTEAVRFNEAFVTAGNAAFRLASVEAIPFANATFDRVLSVNVIYFLADPIPALKEIRRVLRPSGLSVIAGYDPESVKSAAYAKPELGFHVRDGATLAQLHQDAGFRDVEITPYEEMTMRRDGTPWPRSYHFIAARP